MGFLDNLRKLIGDKPAGKSGGGGGGGSTFDDNTYTIYAQCRRCGEVLRGRVNLMNEPSVADDGTWVVRKILSGSGKNLCFQTVEVTLHFDSRKQQVVNSEVSGGKLITADEYEAQGRNA